MGERKVMSKNKSIKRIKNILFAGFTIAFCIYIYTRIMGYGTKDESVPFIILVVFAIPLLILEKIFPSEKDKRE